MGMSKEEGNKIIAFVKREPCLIQDIAKHIGRSWVTTESYVEKIAKDTGLIKTKTFREGTRGAVKIVFWNYEESIQSDEIKARLFEKIKNSASKKDFDPMELFQFADQKKSRAYVEFFEEPLAARNQKLVSFLRSVKEELLWFSGNLSLISTTEGKTKIFDEIEDLLKRGVSIKVLCRVDIASLDNLNKAEKLLKKYPKQIEIRHCIHPVRGFIADRKIVRLISEKKKEDFKGKELERNVRLLFEIHDFEWVDWLQKTFWYLYRTSTEYEQRRKILDKLLG